MKGLLELEGMEFHAAHGCLAHEKAVENLFIVDFRAETDMSAAAESDKLNDTIDYGRVFDIAKREVTETRSDLIENIAGRIVGKIREEFPSCGKFSIRVSKKRPPVNGVAAWARITLYSDDVESAKQSGK